LLSTVFTISKVSFATNSLHIGLSTFSRIQNSLPEAFRHTGYTQFRDLFLISIPRFFKIKVFGNCVIFSAILGHYSYRYQIYGGKVCR
jgi:ABC-type spermidine/putrescine transport system permease subunit I